MLYDKDFSFYGNQVSYRTKGIALSIRVFPRKKVIKLVDRFSSPSMTCKEYHRELNRAISVIKAYYNF